MSAEFEIEIADTVNEEIKRHRQEGLNLREFVRDFTNAAARPSIAQDLEQSGAELDRAYDTVDKAVEAGDLTTALLRFRHALEMQERHRVLGATATDRQIEASNSKPLLGGHTTNELEAVVRQHRLEAGAHSDPDSQPNLSRRERRALAKGRRR